VLGLKFIVALFIIAKLWKQSKYHTTDEWIKKKNVIYEHNEILFSHKEERNYVV
jgi:hypothetical protein